MRYFHSMSSGAMHIRFICMFKQYFAYMLQLVHKDAVGFVKALKFHKESASNKHHGCWRRIKNNSKTTSKTEKNQGDER